MRLRKVKGAEEAVNNSVFCVQTPTLYRGQWQSFFAKLREENEEPPAAGPMPLHIEIGMGKGTFLMQLAALHPNTNYLGIELFPSVLFRAIQKIEEHPLSNLRFLCVNADSLTELFAEGEVDRIYLNFSDPWPKTKHAKRRLTSMAFLERYDRILSANGRIEFKTDNRALFDFSLEEVKNSKWRLIASTYDLHHDPVLSEGNIMTEYEAKFSALHHPICKLMIDRPL
ncbi:MAG: tRNA (guanosine(46)-N7)-methyltransferase TrmB [Lachnospiraceae bacterium]|nr:tRNA (guanosine(46)-N7)-methyltransferase TrmB [Lachnospiraceae bacterium]